LDKRSAISLIQDTLENPFDKRKFAYLVSNMLDHIETAPFIYRGNLIPDAYKAYISTLERIGKYKDREGNKIDLLIVQLKKETSLERARTMQRNFIAWYLNGSRGDVLKDAALAAFISPDTEDWRFSLVKMDYRLDTSGKKVKVKKELTPARRWSFLVGENEKSHTAQSRLVKILANDEQDPTLKEIEKAFDIETVTKEFFLKYRELFLHTKEELDKIVTQASSLRNEFESKGVDTVNFAKKLLGQIIFLYFLQKKGWFGVGRDDDWDTGSKHFLRELFGKKHGDYNNFFNDILEPLFYDALRNDRRHDDGYYSRFNCKIPFLNGGLFDPIGNYNWVHIDILLSDKLFSNQTKTKEGDTGTGILDVFDRYNFTVKEDEPLEKEVAIDPELLGKSYEKFNAIRPDNYAEFKKALKSGKKGEENKFNKKFGVYYTPREIVHYMCQQSLINYLATELSSVIPSEARNLKEDIETLIHTGEQVSENEARVLSKGKETKTYSHQLPESIRKNAKQIDDKLAEITVCDPAVGSGAFPVGMMSEIVKARNVLTVFLNDKGRTAYNFKRRCIEHSLYGVDIDPGAVEIAKLRLWLSLVVDEDDIKNIKPLPNLDYKVVCGNSLLGYPYRPRGLNKIEILKERFLNETRPKDKIKLHEEIDEAIYGLYENTKKSLGYQVSMDFNINFSEVFHCKGGFDIVIANPPYIRQESIRNLKPLLKKAGYEVYNSTSDIYTYFYEKSYQILKPEGFSTFITSNKWMRAKYGENLRKFFKNKTTLLNMIDFSGYKVFEATVDTNILIFKKETPTSDHIINAVNIETDFTNDIELDVYSKKHHLSIVQKEIDSKCFSFADDAIMRLKAKIEAKGTPLKDWDVKIYRGILTGFNKAFIIDTATKERLTRKDSKSAEIIKPILRGRDIGKYYYEWAGLWIIAIPSGWTNKNKGKEKPEVFFKNCFPAIYEYLKDIGDKVGTEEIKAKGKGLYQRDDQGNYWWELRDCDYYPEFNNEKIIYSDIGKKLSFVYEPSGRFLNNTGYFINNGNKYLLAFLNSLALNFYYGQISSQLGNAALRAFTIYIEQLPIPNIPEAEQKPFITLVDQILSLKKSDPQDDTSALEAEIDQIVYKLYGLTEEEIAIIEENVGRR